MQERDVIALFRPDVDSMDDCAWIDGRLFTVDALTENTHFRLDWSAPEDVAFKLVHVNLSDVASCGGIPDSAMLTLGLRGGLPSDFSVRFARALTEELSRFDVKLIGGDTYRSDSLTMSLWMSARADRPLLRSGGKTGDVLYVTGELGGSWAGYRHLQEQLPLQPDVAKKCIKKHVRPEARVRWGQVLAARPNVHAMMDISDGLVQDASRLALASGLDIEIELESLPIPAGIVPPLTLVECSASGEELELLFLAEGVVHTDFPVVPIGRAVQRSAAPSVKFRHQGADILMKPGFLHF